jgi:hypothetical protein
MKTLSNRLRMSFYLAFTIVDSKFTLAPCCPHPEDKNEIFFIEPEVPLNLSINRASDARGIIGLLVAFVLAYCLIGSLRNPFREDKRRRTMPHIQQVMKLSDQ